MQNKMSPNILLVDNSKEGTNFWISSTKRFGLDCLVSVNLSIPSLECNRQNERKGGWNLALINNKLEGYHTNSVESYFIIYPEGRYYKILNINDFTYLTIENDMIVGNDKKDSDNNLWIFS